jgi:Rrf2 family transcriptional regulator, cysteine metabolism repressor
MIFSSKAEYGVRLMIELGRQVPEHPTSLKAIADAEGLPLAYLEQVVARLRKAGLVRSARGAHGGYWLSRPAEEIAMDEVVQALEGSIAPMECFVSDHTERVLCSHEPDAGRGCATKLLWTRVQGGIIRSLQATTLAELVQFSGGPAVGSPIAASIAPTASTAPLTVAAPTAPTAPLTAARAGA